jgi:hypothetical protein
MPDPKSQPAPVSTSPKAPAANPPAANALAIDERFTQLAAQFMAEANASIEAFRQEVTTQRCMNVEPLHKDLLDLLDGQMQAVVRIEKLEAANFVTPESLKEHADQIGDAIAEKLAPKFQSAAGDKRR